MAFAECIYKADNMGSGVLTVEEKENGLGVDKWESKKKGKWLSFMESSCGKGEQRDERTSWTKMQEK